MRLLQIHLTFGSELIRFLLYSHLIADDLMIMKSNLQDADCSPFFMDFDSNDDCLVCCAYTMCLGLEAKAILSQFGLPVKVLAQIW